MNTFLSVVKVDVDGTSLSHEVHTDRSMQTYLPKSV